MAHGVSRGMGFMKRGRAPDGAKEGDGGVRMPEKVENMGLTPLPFFTNYPGRECEPLLRELLLNKSVSACALSAKGNRLRVVLGDDILLLGCPFEDGGESFPCMVYVHEGALTKYVVIHPQTVEYFEEA